MHKLERMCAMEVLRDFKIKIDKEYILRYMGYKGDKSISPALEEELNEQIKLAKDLIEPALVYAEYPIEPDQEKYGIWVNKSKLWKSKFVSQYLKNCNEAVIFVSTIGPKLPAEIEKAFSQGDYLKAMVLDAIADNAIENVNRQFWLRLVNRAIKNGNGITGLLSPGHSDWDILHQKELFELVDASAIGVMLTDTCLMIPIKSTSGIYGIGKDIGISKSSHNCDMCPIKNCFMRQAS